MPKKEQTRVKQGGPSADEVDETEDLLGADFAGEFGEVPTTLEAAIGCIARLAVIKGGYFGLSVSDDRVSCRLVVRTGKRGVDRRFYRLADLEAALAKCLTALRS